MGAPATRSHARSRLRFHRSALGDRALDFARWFSRSRYDLMAGFLGEMERAPAERDADELRQRFVRALRHGERVSRARTAVTVLLALGVLTAMTTTLVQLTDAPAVADALMLLERVAAISTSLSVVLVVARLACDRYLERVDVTATFLAVQLATAPRPSRE